MKHIEKGDHINYDGSIFYVTNLFDIEGDETDISEEVYSVVAKSDEDLWLAIPVEELVYRKRS